MAEVRLEGIGKRFGATVAVDGLDLTVADGELVALLGPTGAGKTTTLRLISGLEALDQGRIRIDNVDVSTAPPAARDVAFVFQQYSLYPRYSVYDNLAFPLRSPARRLPEFEIRQKVESIARLLRIDDKLANKATALSGGQMQRVAIGRALVREPNCFLMDEPLSSLDAKLREDLRVELKRIQRELKATIVYVTHDQIEALTLADRIAVLERGRLLQVAAPEVIYNRPASVEVARRLGSPAINLLPAALAPELAPTGAETLGIRPEDVRLRAAGAAAGYAGLIKQVGHSGSGATLLIETLGHDVHALVDAVDGLERGAPVKVDFRREAIMGFAAGGRRIADDGP